MPEARPLDDDETLTYLHGTISPHRHLVRAPETPMYLDALLADEPLSGGLEPMLGEQHLRTVPERIDQGEAPPLFVLGPSGDAQLINYRVRGAYYIVDRLFAAAELRLGQKPQQVVRITRTDAQPSTAGKKG